jgi:hypothetical protein
MNSLLSLVVVLTTSAVVQAHGSLSCKYWASLQPMFASTNGTAFLNMQGSPATSYVDVTVQVMNLVNGTFEGWTPCEGGIPATTTAQGQPFANGVVTRGMCNATAGPGQVWLKNPNGTYEVNNSMNFPFLTCNNQPNFYVTGFPLSAVPDEIDEPLSIVLAGLVNMGGDFGTQLVPFACCDLEENEPTLPPFTAPPTSSIQVVLFTGVQNLDANAVQYNGVVAGSVTGVLCGFTALVVAVFAFLEK